MKILIISQYYPPEVGAAATRWSEYSQILTDMGHEVTVLTELPNYPTGIIAQGFPKFWFHADHREAGKPEVIRVPVWANPRKTTLQRLGFYATFMLSATLRALALPKYDMIIVSSPPLFVGLIATLLRPFKKATYVLDLRDIWPESAQVLGEIKSARMLAFGRLLERSVYGAVDAFLFAVPGFREYFENHHRTHLDKPMLNLMNGVSSTFIKNIDLALCEEPEAFTVLFSGNIGLAQGLDTLLRSAKSLMDEKIQFRVIGDGAKKGDLQVQAEQLGLDNVSFIGSMKREKLIEEILAADLCLVPLIDSPLFLNAIPSKMLEYMAAGKPVIVGIKGEVEALVKRSGGGLCIQPEDSEALEHAILAYRDDPGRCKKEGQSAAQYIREKFTKEVMIKAAFDQLSQD